MRYLLPATVPIFHDLTLDQMDIKSRFNELGFKELVKVHLSIIATKPSWYHPLQYRRWKKDMADYQRVVDCFRAAFARGQQLGLPIRRRSTRE